MVYHTTYSINFYIEGNGDLEISPDKDEYKEGELVTITATPLSEYRFFYQYSGSYNTIENPLQIFVDGDID